MSWAVYTMCAHEQQIDSLRAMFGIYLWFVGQRTALTIFTSLSYREPCRLIVSGSRPTEIRANMLNLFRFPVAFRCSHYLTSSFFQRRTCRSTFLNRAIAGWSLM